MSLISILVLYLAFRVKQLVCDFFLSYLTVTKDLPFSQGGVKALSLHAGIHASFTLLVVIVLAAQFWWLAIVDFLIHFLIDKCKAVIVHKMQWTYKDSLYWAAFGIDQEAHNLTHLAYIILIVISSGTPLH